ncbi:hypothetical protein HK101_008237 [Irineochytrium annulatum]|nr:hypothetical protein HK101_008237 [Irineochytrium annulatum]
MASYYTDLDVEHPSRARRTVVNSNPDLGDFMSPTSSGSGTSGPSAGELLQNREGFLQVASMFSDMRDRLAAGGSAAVLDGLITQLIGEADAFDKGPPPASKFFVRNLPDVKPTKAVGKSCPICVEPFTAAEGEGAKEVPCGHLFHRGCIRPWLGLHNSCPMCRHEFPTDDKAYEKIRKEKMRKLGKPEEDDDDPTTHMYG